MTINQASQIRKRSPSGLFFLHFPKINPNLFAHVIFFSYLCSRKGFLNMAQEETIKLFENSKVRIVWDEEKETSWLQIVVN